MVLTLKIVLFLHSVSSLLLHHFIDALAAVTVPSFEKTAFKVGIFLF
jgi:hypothetical protein